MSRNIFNSIPVSIPKRNHFDLTHDIKFTCNMGELVPICSLECVPGDQFSISGEMLIKFAPLVAPAMHRFDATVHYFFVPNRLLWAEWEWYITGGERVDDDGGLTFPIHPYIEVNRNSVPRLLDFFGIGGHTAATSGTLTLNALPFAAYQLIYNEYYRDQNLVPTVYGDIDHGPTSADFPLVSGNNTSSAWLQDIRIRAWEHDYFTGCLPFAQKGDAVGLPIGLMDTPIFTNQAVAGGNPHHVPGQDNSGTPHNYYLDAEITTTPGIQSGGLYMKGDDIQVTTTIQDFRRALKLQEFLEKSARVGTRYVEHLGGFWGVRPQDSRLDRPEYITGVKTPIVISEILNTAGVDTGDPLTTLPQGNMSGHGVGVSTGYAKSYFCAEHGWIIGILSVRPKTSYQDGIPKKFLRTGDRYDYYWPQFANIGEQEVINLEVHSAAALSGVFGYVPRYAEYKFHPNLTVGQFRTTLAHWTCTRILPDNVGLNQDFIECVPRLDMFAVTDDAQDHIYGIVLNKIHALRPMPKFGTPKI